MTGVRRQAVRFASSLVAGGVRIASPNRRSHCGAEFDRPDASVSSQVSRARISQLLCHTRDDKRVKTRKFNSRISARRAKPIKQTNRHRLLPTKGANHKGKLVEITVVVANRVELFVCFVYLQTEKQNLAKTRHTNWTRLFILNYKHKMAKAEDYEHRFGLARYSKCERGQTTTKRVNERSLGVAALLLSAAYKRPPACDEQLSERIAPTAEWSARADANRDLESRFEIPRAAKKRDRNAAAATPAFIILATDI